MNWRCAFLFWHRIVVKRRVSRDSDYLRCSCGREYGINHGVRVVLPWDDVRNAYEH